MVYGGEKACLPEYGHKLNRKMQQKGGKAIVQYRAIECCFLRPSFPQAKTWRTELTAVSEHSLLIFVIYSLLIRYLFVFKVRA